jgi:hypothetical protein
MNGRLGHRVATLAAVGLGLCAAPAFAVVLGQIDDFQTGTMQGWTGGTSASNQPSGGPGGTGDRYMRLSSAGGNLGTYNTAQWSGDYGTAGVTRIDIDLSNWGPDPVSLRLMVMTPGCAFGAGGCTAWTQTNATVLPAGSGWVKVEFSLAEADLTRVLGSSSYAESMASIERIHLKHDPGPPDPPGVAATVNAVLGVDNVVALPEPPGRVGLAAATLVLTLAFPRGRRRGRGEASFLPRGKGVP